MTPSALIHEKPIEPGGRTTPKPPSRPPIVTRAEVAPCTCPEPCERDHENE